MDTYTLQTKVPYFFLAALKMDETKVCVV
jgi:hypothetical protein